jgi:hypothetical protein
MKAIIGSVPPTEDTKETVNVPVKAAEYGAANDTVIDGCCKYPVDTGSPLMVTAGTGDTAVVTVNTCFAE